MKFCSCSMGAFLTLRMKPSLCCSEGGDHKRQNPLGGAKGELVNKKLRTSMHVGNTDMSAKYSAETKALTTVATTGAGAVSARVHVEMVWMRVEVLLLFDVISCRCFWFGTKKMKEGGKKYEWSKRKTRVSTLL